MPTTTTDPLSQAEPTHRALRAANRYLPALLADLLAFILLLWLVPPLARQFQAFGFFNSVLMGLFFLLFCIAVVWLKRLQPYSSGLTLPPFIFERRFLGVLGVFFALCASTATAYVVGFLDSVIAINRGLLDEPSIALYLLLTPASWFGLALIYMLILTTETEPRLHPGQLRYGIASFLGLLGVNLMGLVFTAAWLALWARFSHVQAGSPLLLLNILLFLLLLGPPRLIYLSRVRQLLPAFSFLLFVIYLALLSTPI